MKNAKMLYLVAQKRKTEWQYLETRNQLFLKVTFIIIY